MPEEGIVTAAPQESQIADAIGQAETTPQEPAHEAPPEPRKLKVKHLHEDKEVTEEEAIPLIQKGMDYDRVKTQAEQLQEDRKFLEGLAKDYGMDPATLKAELSKAAKATRVQELTTRGIPEDVAEEILENRKYREEQKVRETQAEAESRRQREASEFLKEFPDVKPGDIPQSVWKDVESGIPLVHAYSRHETATLRAKLAKAASVEAVAAQSAANAAAAPGSVSGAPAAGNDYISQEAFVLMSDKDIARNWEKVSASRKHWK